MPPDPEPPPRGSVVQAFFVMVHIPYLQPFDDVNKRVSRLAANIPFLKQNLAPLSFVDVPEPDYVDGTLGIYELRRVELARDVFAWAYERSCQRYTVVRDALRSRFDHVRHRGV
jgi:Fic family protein